MHPKRDLWTRRQFLASIGVGSAVLAVPLNAVASETGADTSFRFVQICDTQLGFGGYEHDLASFRQAVLQINALCPDFVVICGDLVNTPDSQSFADFNAIRTQFNMPCFCVPGNHDVGNQPSLTSLQTFRQAVGQDHFSFEHKGHLFVVVNTQLWKAPIPQETEAHDTWLQARLTAAVQRRMPVIVMGHHPLFLDAPDEEEGYYSLPVVRRRVLLDMFVDAGVAAVLAGHTHKLIINDYQGMQLVNGETPSRNFDERPLGFRLWQLGDARPFRHTFIALTSQ